MGPTMTQFPFAVVGFDLDGTLLDTSRDLADAVNHALGVAGRPLLSLEEIKPMIGGGAKKMLERGLEATGGCSDDEMKRLYSVLLEYYEQNLSNGTVAFPGMLDALDRLASMGVKLAVCTNKFERFAQKLLSDLGLRDRFVALIGGDTMGKGNAKPSAAPIHEMIARSGGGSAAFVGDSIYDVMAAKNAGIPSVAVSFGFLNQPVEELGADAIIDHYDSLIPTLDRLG